MQTEERSDRVTLNDKVDLESLFSRPITTVYLQMFFFLEKLMKLKLMFGTQCDLAN